MSENLIFWRIFARRTGISFFVLVVLFLSCILRVAATVTSDYTLVQQKQNSLKLTAGRLRGTIYDCNMVPITNNKKKIIACVSPTPRAITAISCELEGQALTDTLERLKSGKPVLCEVEEYIKCDGIVCTTVYEHNSADTLAEHLVGYTGSDNHGVSGLEAAYDDLLYSEDEIAFYYECSGTGDILEGIEATVENNSSVIANGIMSTLDVNIQSIAESAAEGIEKGAVIVAEAKTGKIRACVSRPSFDIENIGDYLEAQNSPLLNRAINAYNVGSVFKPCVAIAGIENSLQNFTYTCTGSCEIIDRFFKCHKRDGHGFVDLHSALAYSCNTFFYNFSFNIGGEEVYKAASSLKFGQALKLCDGIYTAKGNLPSRQTLKNIAQLANFSIGQGELLLSPISILTLYSAIASGGSYYVPSVVEGTLKDGSFEAYDCGNPTRVMTAETAARLSEYLAAVLTEGTGEDAMPSIVSAAGKTATAQTGKYNNGVEICEGWFCGFFPVEDPQYVVVVFSENTSKQTLTCAKIFAKTADDITQLKG